MGTNIHHHIYTMHIHHVLWVLHDATLTMIWLTGRKRGHAHHPRDTDETAKRNEEGGRYWEKVYVFYYFLFVFQNYKTVLFNLILFSFFCLISEVQVALLQLETVQKDVSMLLEQWNVKSDKVDELDAVHAALDREEDNLDRYIPKKTFFRPPTVFSFWANWLTVQIKSKLSRWGHDSNYPACEAEHGANGQKCRVKGGLFYDFTGHLPGLSNQSK